MKDTNVVREKSYSFALRIVKLYKFLVRKNEFVLSKQILRCGTSIGANVEEAIGAQSKKDFISKMSIAYKESRETHYWLRILRDVNYVPVKAFDSLLKDFTEVQKLIVAILKTSKTKV